MTSSDRPYFDGNFTSIQQGGGTYNPIARDHSIARSGRSLARSQMGSIVMRLPGRVA